MPNTVIPTFRSAQDLARFIADAHWVSRRTHFFTPKTMRFFDSRLLSVVVPLQGNEGHRQSFAVVVSDRYRDLHDPALDGDRFYRVVRVDIRPDGDRVTTSADYVTVDGVEQWDSRLDAIVAAGTYAGSTNTTELEE